MIQGWFDDLGQLRFEIDLIAANELPVTGILDGQEFDIPVVAGMAIEEYLLGVPWLRTRRLVADLPAGLLTLG